MGNRIELRPGANEEPAYCPTEPTRAQRAALRSLRMTHLIDEQAFAARIPPRRRQ
jgi:hypothetical protein